MKTRITWMLILLVYLSACQSGEKELVDTIDLAPELTLVPDTSTQASKYPETSTSTHTPQPTEFEEPTITPSPTVTPDIFSLEERAAEGFLEYDPPKVSNTDPCWTLRYQSSRTLSFELISRELIRFDPHASFFVVEDSVPLIVDLVPQGSNHWTGTFTTIIQDTHFRAYEDVLFVTDGIEWFETATMEEPDIYSTTITCGPEIWLRHED
jgi:hypothetical protein